MAKEKKPMAPHKHKILAQYHAQAQADAEAMRAGRDPAFYYYFHDEQQRLMQLTAHESLTKGASDRKAAGGYRDFYAAKGFRVLGADEIMPCVEKMQSRAYEAHGEASPFAAPKRKAVSDGK